MTPKRNIGVRSSNCSSTRIGQSRTILEKSYQIKDVGEPVLPRNERVSSRVEIKGSGESYVPLTRYKSIIE